MRNEFCSFLLHFVTTFFFILHPENSSQWFSRLFEMPSERKTAWKLVSPHCFFFFPSIRWKWLIWCRCDESYLWSTMWPRYVVTLKARSRERIHCCKFGTSLVASSQWVWGQNVFIFLRQRTWNLGRGCKIVSHHQHICRCECSHANSLHVICLFSPLSGFTFHTLSSLGVLGTGDLKWLRAERNLREIQLSLSVCFAFRATVAL